MRSVKYLTLLFVVVLCILLFTANAVPTYATPPLVRPTATPRPFSITITYRQLNTFIQSAVPPKDRGKKTSVVTVDGLLLSKNTISDTVETQSKVQVDAADGKVRFTFLAFEVVVSGKVTTSQPASAFTTPFTIKLGENVHKYLLGRMGKRYVVQAVSLQNNGLLVTGVR
jgi:hypothetical protein